MGVFFGTDGLRGKVNDDLSCHIAYRCGNALGSKNSGARILIGKDTRKSGDLILLSVASGLVSSGCDVTSVGVCPTAGVSYLTSHFGFDFGVVISASHNPAEFNGIKIFDRTGKKLGDKLETELEKCFLKETILPPDKLGAFHEDFGLVKSYFDFLFGEAKGDLSDLRLVLDCSNGASYKLAPKVFKKCGAKVFVVGAKPNGKNINSGCGSLCISSLQSAVKKHRANVGFAFDGDSDRLICVDEKGNIVDGDMILYLFALEYKKQGKLFPPVVVGTRHTNMGVEKALQSHGIELIRTDIGDKYVGAKLSEKGLVIGGEQSGHIFVKDKLCTGDGILNAILIASIMKSENKKLSEFFDLELYCQTNLNVPVKDKMKVINSEKLSKTQEEVETALGENGRVMVRVSGTEPYVRVMVECKDKNLADAQARAIEKVILEIDREFEQCVE